MARLTKVRNRMSIHAHRKVRGLLEGEYAAVTTGRSMDFNDLREYVPGDDVKDIDWKATARAGHPLIKRYVAVRQHTILLVVSTGRSMAAMNELETPKRDVAIMVAGIIGWVATGHGDRVGLYHGNAGGHHFVPTGSTEVHLERCLAAVERATTPQSPPSDLAGLLRFVIRTERRRSIAFVICDEPELDTATRDLVARLSVQHEVLFVTIGDLLATDDILGALSVRDIDTGRRLPRQFRDDHQLRQDVARLVEDQRVTLTRNLDRLGIVHEHVVDDDTAIRAVFRLLERHRRARR